MMRKRLPEVAIILDYQNGCTSTELGTKYHCAHSSILRCLERNNIPKRSISYRRYSFQIPKEDADDEHFAYWIGFLLADGCVADNALIVNLQLADFDHLVKLRSWLYSEHPIKQRKNYCHFYLSSYDLYRYSNGVEKPTDKTTPYLAKLVEAKKLVNSLETEFRTLYDTNFGLAIIRDPDVELGFRIDRSDYDCGY